MGTLIGACVVAAIVYGIGWAFRYDYRALRFKYGRRPADIAAREASRKRWGNLGRKLFGD